MAKYTQPRRAPRARKPKQQLSRTRVPTKPAPMLMGMVIK